MHDTLGYLEHDPVHRPYHHGELTFSLVYACSENFVLPISHDEVVHGKGSLLRKMPGDRWQQLANLRAYLAFMWAHPGKQLLFMGCEIGQESEWAEAASSTGGCSTTPSTAASTRCVYDLNRVYADSAALWSRDNEPSAFQWIDANDAGPQHVLVHPARARVGRRRSWRCVCGQLLGRPSRATTGSASRRPALARGRSTPTPGATPAPASATWGCLTTQQCVCRRRHGKATSTY